MIAVPHSRNSPTKMTAQEYLKWETKQEIRYEYSGGEVFAMTGGTKGHNKLALNLYGALEEQVESDGCEMNTSDVKVMVSELGAYRYPDLVVSCDERDQQNPDFYTYPKLIVEVLSPGTEAVDRNKKFQEYIQIPTLEEYVLINTDQMQVECFRRGEGRIWLYYPYKAEDTVEIQSMGVEFEIEQLYRNVRLEASDAEPPAAE